MAFTAQLGTVDSYPANIELGFGSAVVPHNIYSGIYTLVAGKRNDTLYTLINLPQIITNILKIPNPFLATAFVADNAQEGIRAAAGQEQIIHIAGIKLRVVGEGNLIPTLYALDTATFKQLRSMLMHTIDDTEPVRLCNFVSQRVYLRLETQAQDEIFTINRIIIYMKPIWSSRPNTNV
jgi:hypothetical protein